MGGGKRLNFTRKVTEWGKAFVPIFIHIRLVTTRKLWIFSITFRRSGHLKADWLARNVIEFLCQQLPTTLNFVVVVVVDLSGS